MLKQVAIVCPVYEDWESFVALIRRLATLYAGGGIAFHVAVVDDGSPTPPPDLADLVPPESCIAEVELLQLALNLGHQRAIAVGLCHLAPRTDLDAVIVMDSDGEDRPEDIGVGQDTGADVTNRGSADGVPLWQDHHGGVGEERLSDGVASWPWRRT
jgi:hypothetical protein